MMDIETLKVQLQETEANMAHRLKELTDAIDEANIKCKKYSNALKRISEYWNGDNNEEAMKDALEHIVEIARGELDEQ